MAEPDEALRAEQDDLPAPRRRRWPLVLAIAGGLVLIGLIVLWASRERIAGNIIGSQLEQSGLPATYEIERIGPVRQVLRNIVIGDPANPDLTIEEAQVSIRYRLGLPVIGRIVAVRPRLYGRWRDGRLSFGSLDKVLFPEEEQERAFRLPDLDVAIADGRALLETEWGPVGVKLAGAGRLRNGFRGTIGAIAPAALVEDCRIAGASLYGALEVNRERPNFEGPVRIDRLACADGTSLRQAALQIDATLDRGVDGGEAELAFESGAASLAGVRAGTVFGTGSLAYRNERLTARYDLTASRLATSALAAAGLRTTGSLRSQNGLARFEIDGELQGTGLAPGSDLDASLAEVQRGTQGTLLAPMLGQIRTALRREAPGSRLTVSYLARSGETGPSLVIPSASLRGGSGRTLLSVSRFHLSSTGGKTPMLAGNFSVGGAGLPQIAGRMQRPAGGSAIIRLTMSEYRAGGGSLAIPRLLVAQAPGGALGFAGQARLSGPLPGGSARGLVIPIDGNWSQRAGLSLWRSCTPVGFESLTWENLTLDARRLTLCPPRGSAIVRSTDAGLRFAAGASGLDLAGRLGSTPIRISSGPVGFAVPGKLDARSLEVSLGPVATASNFRLGHLTARFGREITGRFEDTEMRLNAVPMDLVEGEGGWRFAEGTLSIADGSFRLLDRRPDARFQPLRGENGRVALSGNIITADAILREPSSGRMVTRVDIRHDLASGRGHADLAMPGIVFDSALQPSTISRLFLGVVANVEGSVRGSGRVDWTPETTTSRGSLTTDDLDFAAAFGPVKGASGTIVFTDLLGLVTAPNQKLRVASVNPGIEVTDGVLDFELRPNTQLVVNGGTWPFMGGTLTLEATQLNFGVTETRRYTLRIVGLEAAKFVERMELANINATGVFDGVLPLIFDENGGRIEGGQLNSRPPGGNVSYVGALTYEDLSTMANFAFEALKSLDYREMRIAMDGALTGEIVTRVRISGVTQGEGASKNFITQRIARLPITFRINVRAPFYQIITSFKSFNDPAFVRDPRELGLLDAQGRPIDDEVTGRPPADAIKPEDIQPSDSR